MKTSQVEELLDSIDNLQIDLTSYWEDPGSASIVNGVLKAKATSLAFHLDKLGLTRLAADLRWLDIDEVGIVEFLETLRGHFAVQARNAIKSVPNRGASIPAPVILVVGEVLGTLYYNHNRLNALFAEAGAPGDPPAGSCVVKCQAWLRRTNDSPVTQPLDVLGGVLVELMEHDRADLDDEWARAKARVEKLLAKNSLEYNPGGLVLKVGTGVASRTLEATLAERDHPSIEAEFRRALDSAAKDPEAALTAACSIVEAACKVYLEANNLALPSKQTIKYLWGAVQADLGLEPGKVEDDDLKRILGGLASVVDGLGALRTHAGSAHGHGSLRYRVSSRHARLAVNAAHTVVTFILETWTARRGAV